MTRPTLVVALVSVLALSLVSAVSAASTSTLRHRELRQRSTIWADRGTVRFFARRPWLARTPAGRRALRFARAELAWTRRELAETRAALRPQPVAAAAGHWALWSCITNGAYPGAAHEGNGYNGPYSGPLGMTTPWAGHYPTGGDWVHTPVATVYAIAEEEFARNGYSTSWLRGQWPKTSPPCLR